MELFADQPLLNTIWFLFIGIFFIGYLILDGFDLGVGMMMSKLFAKNEKERRLLLNTIGPVWDGNEVWLVTAGAGLFAAFPLWYASLFSGMYIPLTLMLVALIFRVVAIDYRGKANSPRWTGSWNMAINIASFSIPFFVGALLGATSTGLPINHNGDVVGAFAWAANPFTYIAGLGIMGFSYAQGLAFVALKTEGDVRERARRQLTMLMPVLLIPLLIWVLNLQLVSGNMLSWSCVAVAGMAMVWAYLSNLAGREGQTFSGLSIFMGTGALAIFLAMFPNVFPSTLDAAYSLTVTNASSSPYTLTFMTWIAGFSLPLIMIYQGWSYYQFRQRLKVENIPDLHDADELAKLPAKAPHK